MARNTVLVVMAVVLASPVAAEPRTLFVGNSYSFANNDLLATGFAALVAETTGGQPTVDMVAKGGYTFTGHLADAGQEGEQLHQFLAADGAKWDTVVLQEQSVIPAYHEAIATGWYESLEAAQGLDGLIKKTGANTLFLMTWGRREGLAEDAQMLPDYPTMQALLAGGYQKYALLTSTPERPVRVAPVGLAWQTIWDDAVAAGNDPLDPDGLFWRLYTGDGSHPSVRGSYLASLVVFATVTGTDPESTHWRPDPVTEGEAAILRHAARRAVLGEDVVPIIESVEAMPGDATTQPTDLMAEAEVVAPMDVPALETLTTTELPRAPESTTLTPEGNESEVQPTVTGKNSGCGTSTVPFASGVGPLVLLLFLLCGLRFCAFLR